MLSSHLVFSEALGTQLESVVMIFPYHHHYPPQETHSLGGPGQVPDGQGSAGSLALSEGHITSHGSGQQRGGDGYEEFLGGQSAGQVTKAWYY